MELNTRKQAFVILLFLSMVAVKKDGHQMSGFGFEQKNSRSWERLLLDFGFLGFFFSAARRANAHAAPRLKASELNY